jgi:hypothetical protein
MMTKRIVAMVGWMTGKGHLETRKYIRATSEMLLWIVNIMMMMMMMMMISLEAISRVRIAEAQTAPREVTTETVRAIVIGTAMIVEMAPETGAEGIGEIEGTITRTEAGATGDDAAEAAATPVAAVPRAVGASVMTAEVIGMIIGMVGKADETAESGVMIKIEEGTMGTINMKGGVEGSALTVEIGADVGIEGTERGTGRGTERGTETGREGETNGGRPIIEIETGRIRGVAHLTDGGLVPTAKRGADRAVGVVERAVGIAMKEAKEAKETEETEEMRREKGHDPSRYHPCMRMMTIM